MTVGSDTFISDSLKLVRSILASGVTDPISGARPSDSMFVVTNYPSRVAVYPLIQLKLSNFSTDRIGNTSENDLILQEMEIRIWAKNETQKDQLTQQVHDVLRSKQYDGGAGTVDNGLHDFKILSTSNVDEDDDNPKSRILHVQYMVVT